MGGQLTAIAIGAVLGAWLRWALGNAFNHLHAHVPIGTFAANLIGGYLIGVAVEVFSRHLDWPPEIRLACVTGFLGALTTFSTFSAEAVTLLGRGEYGWMLAHMLSHLIGSILMTIFGMHCVRWIAG